MAGWSEMGTGAKASVGGAAALVAALLGYGVWQSGQPPVPPVTVTLAEVPEAETVADPAAAPEAQPEPEAAPVESAPEAEAAPEATEPTVIAPEPDAAPPAPATFDVVRIEPDGAALVAGTAAPGAAISLLVDGVEVAQASAGADGKFAALFTLGASAAPRMLAMTMILADGTEVPSPDRVALAPTAVPEAVAALEPEAAPTESAAPPAAPGGEPAPTETAAEPEAEAPAGLLVTEEGVTVLQPGGEALPDTESAVSLVSIAYTEDGAVAFGGAGTPGQMVRLYLDNAQIAAVEVAGNGAWLVTMTGIEPGLYTLRADQVDAGGKVTSRIETPFKRETLEALAEAMGLPAPETPSAPLAEPDVIAALEAPAVEPVPTEPAPTESTPTESTPTEPAPTELAPTEPAQPDAAPAEPALAEPAPAEPVAPEPAPTEPVQTEAAPAEPAPVESAPVEPEPAEPAPTEPAPVEPAPVEPAPVDPAPEAPPAAEPAPAEPPPADPGVTEAPAEEPVPVVPAEPVAPAEPVVVAEAPPAEPAVAPVPPAPVTITVQPGFTLWGIAKDHMGEGIMYVQVYKANRDKIRDPDLIYPGQVFMMPAKE